MGCEIFNEMEAAGSMVTEGLEAYSRRCICEACKGCEEGITPNLCSQQTRISNHIMDIGRILARCPDVTTLIIGPDRKRFTCHKALLGFKSEYFDAACFGTFTSNEVGEIHLEEENPEAVSAFVAWLYTGRIPIWCSIEPAVLWVLGDKLRSPGFANEAMHFNFRKYYNGWLTAATAEYVYSNTTSGSKLRAFIKDMILQEGPFFDQAGRGDDELDYERDWRDLIRQGGDLVVDISLEGSFRHCSDDETTRPWHWKNHHKYLEPVTTRSIEDFLEGKPREGTRKLKQEGS